MGVVSSTAGHGGGNNGKDKNQQPQLNGDDQDGPDNGGHSQTLWILIFRGHPRDIQSTRVTELYIVFDETSYVDHLNLNRHLMYVVNTCTHVSVCLLTHDRLTVEITETRQL